MENNMTSLEWYIETMSNKHIGFKTYVNANKEIIEQANEMNNQELSNAYEEGWKDATTEARKIIHNFKYQ
jgi:hypothetical protein